MPITRRKTTDQTEQARRLAELRHISERDAIEEIDFTPTAIHGCFVWQPFARPAHRFVIGHTADLVPLAQQMRSQGVEVLAEDADALSTDRDLIETLARLIEDDRPCVMYGQNVSRIAGSLKFAAMCRRTTVTALPTSLDLAHAPTLPTVSVASPSGRLTDVDLTTGPISGSSDQLAQIIHELNRGYGIFEAGHDAILAERMSSATIGAATEWVVIQSSDDRAILEGHAARIAVLAPDTQNLRRGAAMDVSRSIVQWLGAQPSPAIVTPPSSTPAPERLSSTERSLAHDIIVGALQRGDLSDPSRDLALRYLAETKHSSK